MASRVTRTNFAYRTNQCQVRSNYFMPRFDFPTHIRPYPFNNMKIVDFRSPIYYRTMSNLNHTSHSFEPEPQNKKVLAAAKALGILAVGTLSMYFLEKAKNQCSDPRPRFNKGTFFVTGTTQDRWIQEKGLVLKEGEIITLKDDMYCVPLPKAETSEVDKAIIEKNNEKAMEIAKRFARDPYASHLRKPDPKYIIQDINPCVITLISIEDIEGSIGGAGQVDLYFQPGQRFQIVRIEKLSELSQLEKQRSYDNRISLMSMRIKAPLRGI